MQGTFSSEHSQKNQKYKTFQIIFWLLLVSINKCQRDSRHIVPIIVYKPSDLSFSPAPGNFGESCSLASEEPFYPQHIPYPYDEPQSSSPPFY